MVALTTHSFSHSGAYEAPLDLLAEGLALAARQQLQAAVARIRPLYADKTVHSGESLWRHAVGMGLIVASLKLDVETRLASLLHAVPECLENAQEVLTQEFGYSVTQLVLGLCQLNKLNVLTRSHVYADAGEARAQTEVWRKMLLAMVEDVRVVLLRLSSRVQTLRYYAEHAAPEREDFARENLEIYAPLANRLGVWQLKWELEDLSFRFLEPDTYKHIARMLDERRVGREQFITNAIERLQQALIVECIDADVLGRPKHIYSIYSKMRSKNIDFDKLYDVRALRIIVPDIQDCYAALSVVHHIWQAIPSEFDDYIADPKANDYRSLHTAVRVQDGRSLEVQIRTEEMHRHAELGIAAHWRYKEGAPANVKADTKYDNKIACLRQLLSWRDEVTDSADWVAQFKQAELDDTIYVLTPQDRVIDLPRGATPIDFAYRVHSDLGHHCRGAKVDGVLVPLSTPLKNGQRVEILASKQGGPSRDWLSLDLKYLVSPRARIKVRQWFAAQDETLGRSETHSEQAAASPRALNVTSSTSFMPFILPQRSRAGAGDNHVLIAGVDQLLTQLGRCCKPAPPDAIGGFVTRGKGVSIHRLGCKNFKSMSGRVPERVISVAWVERSNALYPVDIFVEADDRQGLLRDISEVLSKEKMNVTAVNTLSRQAQAKMEFTIEVNGVPQLQRALKLIGEVDGVRVAHRSI